MSSKLPDLPKPDFALDSGSRFCFYADSVRAIQEAAFNAGRAEAASEVGFLITQAWMALTEPMPKVMMARDYLVQAMEVLTPTHASTSAPTQGSEPAQPVPEPVLIDAAPVYSLLRRALGQLTQWQKKYGEHRGQIQWLPPAGGVRLAEDIDAVLNQAPTPPAAISQEPT